MSKTRKSSRGWFSFFRRRGRVLEVKLGYNPNSSSIGADLTPVILFSGFLSIAVPALVVFLRSRTRKGEGEAMGAGSEAS